MRHVLFSGLILSFAALPTSAQQPQRPDSQPRMQAVTLGPGARIRVTHGCGPRTTSAGDLRMVCKRAVGSLTTWTPSTLTLEHEASGNSMQLSLASARRLEISHGTYPPARVRGAVFGALFGAPVGFGMGLILEGLVCGSACGGEIISGSMLVGIGLGVVGGALLTNGARDDWVNVPLRQIRNTKPAPRGTRIGLALVF